MTISKDPELVKRILLTTVAKMATPSIVNYVHEAMDPATYEPEAYKDATPEELWRDFIVFEYHRLELPEEEYKP